jgi:ribosomal-protein-alanine N-acetyltransferase
MTSPDRPCLAKNLVFVASIHPNASAGTNMGFPEISTSRLKLTKLTEDDAEDVFGIFSNEQVIEYYDLGALKQASQALSLINFFNARLDSNIGIRWGIRLKESNRLIGTCGFNSWSPKMKSAELGYDLLPRYWGYAYASEAVQAILEAAYSGHLPCGNLNRIQADTVPDNFRSEKLLRKLGFKEEGLRREAGYWGNAFHDLKCFSLLEGEYVKASSLSSV